MASPRARVVEQRTNANVVLGVLLGLAGGAFTAWSLGRSSAPSAGCCERLVQRDLELLRCEQGHPYSPPRGHRNPWDFEAQQRVGPND